MSISDSASAPWGPLQVRTDDARSTTIHELNLKSTVITLASAPETKSSEGGVPILRQSPITSLSLRERHGRGFRPSVIPPTVPAFRSRAETFDAIAMEAAQVLAGRLLELDIHLGSIEFVVEDVPTADPPAWESPRIKLSHVTQSSTGAPRIVLFRRPIECSANGRRELAELMYHVMLTQIAQLAGCNPQDIDPEHLAP